MTKDVNAWAMANGCVRVYSGLMDMMNDNEVRGVVGHEMGHVALGHTKKAMQVAYATFGGAFGGVIGGWRGGRAVRFATRQFLREAD